MTDYLEDTLTRFPDKLAFVGETSAFTFSQLKKEAESLATFLIEKKWYHKPIFVFMERSPEEVAAFLGIIKADNFHVALDLEMGDYRLKHILSIVEAPLMICDRFTVEKAETLGFTGEIILYEEAKRPPSLKKLEEVGERVLDINPIYIIFTSGSTGVPKGIVANHRSVVDYIEEITQILDCDETTIFGSQAPLYLDTFLREFYTTLKTGATTYLLPKILFTSPVRLLAFFNEKKINTLSFVVSALTLFTKLGALNYERPKYLRTIAFGGEVFPLNHFEEWKRNCPEAKFINLYGPTECTGASSYYIVDKKRVYKDSIPIGKPLANCEMFLLDEEKRQVPKGEKGEICIRGTAVTMGYYGDRKRSSETFVQNPLQPNFLETIYRTGDIGYWDEEGNMVFVGRKDHQIKHRGYRIELEEIESVARSQAGVTDCVCVYQKEKERLYLVYLGEEMEMEVKKKLREILPAYMLPSKVVKLNHFPTLPSGKVDRFGILKRIERKDKR